MFVAKNRISVYIGGCQKDSKYAKFTVGCFEDACNILLLIFMGVLNNTSRKIVFWYRKSNPLDKFDILKIGMELLFKSNDKIPFVGKISLFRS